VQIRQLVNFNCIRPLCELLTVNDVRIITVAMEGLENILKVCLEEWCVLVCSGMGVCFL
jgi:hypothetical protein